jgi:hypothetical protein
MHNKKMNLGCLPNFFLVSLLIFLYQNCFWQRSSVPKFIKKKEFWHPPSLSLLFPFCFPFVSLSQNLVEKPNFGKRKGKQKGRDISVKP